MSALVPGTCVMVVPQRELLRLGCHLRHYLGGLALDGAIGVVDRIDNRYRDHRVIVRFPSLHCPPFGTVWVDAFRADELVMVAE